MSKLLNDGRIGEPPSADHSLPLLRLAFRPFFLLGALFSIIALGLWAAVFSGGLQVDVYGGALWWHQHEMLFGFVSAIVVGFLLTAVQTWTGVPGIRGGGLLCLVALWISGRLVFFLPLPEAVVLAVDLAFLPAAALVLGRSVVKVKQWRNTIFIPILLAMTAANALLHVAAQGGGAIPQSEAGGFMVLLVTLLMTIMGGRVIPMFTANGTRTERVETLPWLEKGVVVTTLLVVLIAIPGVSPPPSLAAAAFIAAALFQAARVFRWRFSVTLGTPLVWSLHLSYWCIPLGLLIEGLVSLQAPLSHSQAIHTLGVGAMGLMILAMISRVSLGHTGRPLVVGQIMSTAFLAVFAAFILRVFGASLGIGYPAVIGGAVVLWSLGYGIFLLVYWPILSRPRADGRPG